MLDQFLTRIFSSWIAFAILAVVLLALSEFGWRVGLAHSRAKPEKTKDDGSVPAAVLTLLGLLLGFSFAMAVSRHETRRELVVQEANSIITTARRARLLPEPQAGNAGTTTVLLTGDALHPGTNWLRLQAPTGGAMYYSLTLRATREK